MENINMRMATKADVDRIWELLQKGIQKRKEEGSWQWQDGYPNRHVVLNDVEHHFGYVAIDKAQTIVGYVAVIDDTEPAYDAIDGKWLSNGAYMVVHRLIVDLEKPIKGLATWMMQKVEEYTKTKAIPSIKVDTNYDNAPMLHIFNKLGYQYCGEVQFRGTPRKAYEKLLPSELYGSHKS